MCYDSTKLNDVAITLHRRGENIRKKVCEIGETHRIRREKGENFHT